MRIVLPFTMGAEIGVTVIGADSCYDCTGITLVSENSLITLEDMLRPYNTTSFEINVEASDYIGTVVVG